jgi:hypothetical protein
MTLQVSQQMFQQSVSVLRNLIQPESSTVQSVGQRHPPNANRCSLPIPRSN